jgi:hypothetical protein
MNQGTLNNLPPKEKMGRIHGVKWITKHSAGVASALVTRELANQHMIN